MSNPSFENIDRWLFEHAEGNLSPAQVEQLDQFLFLNPDLALEKDAWESAKVSQTQMPLFSTTSLQRANPLFMYLWTGFAGLFLIILSVIAFDSSILSASSRYVKETIDTSVIENHNELKKEYFIANLSPEKKELISQNNSLQPVDKRNDTRSVVTQEPSNSSNVNSTQKSLSAFVNIDKELKESEEVVDFTTDDRNDFAQLSSNTNRVIESPELKSVVASLSVKGERDDLLVASDNRSFLKSSGVSASKVVSQKFKAAFRKVKRMADQPVALRNYKDPYFHAPYMTGYQANFGMVGTLLRNRFQATSRNQFVGEDNQQLMNTLSWDGYIYALRGGVGLDLNYSDYQNGSLQNFSAGLTYSPKFSINNNISIEPAVRFKMGMIDLDTESSIIGNQIEMDRRSLLGVFNEGVKPIGSQLWYRDIGAGVLLNTKWFYAGFNLDNVHRHYNNFYSADINATHQADLNMTSVLGTSYAPVGKDITYSAYLLHQKFASLNELWGGASIRWNWFELGGGVSDKLDFGASAGVVLDKFSLNYNIDYLDSRLLNKQLLSHQVTIRIVLKPTGVASRFLSL